MLPENPYGGEDGGVEGQEERVRHPSAGTDAVSHLDVDLVLLEDRGAVGSVLVMPPPRVLTYPFRGYLIAWVDRCGHAVAGMLQGLSRKASRSAVKTGTSCARAVAM